MKRPGPQVPPAPDLMNDLDSEPVDLAALWCREANAPHLWQAPLPLFGGVACRWCRKDRRALRGWARRRDTLNPNRRAKRQRKD